VVCALSAGQLCPALSAVKDNFTENDFRIPMKPVRLIKKCLNETYSRIRVGKHLSVTFPIKNCLKQGHAYRYGFSAESE
jgi:hypothetical protein